MEPLHEKSAVLVIDVQQGLCVGDGAAFQCAATIERINLVTGRARSAGLPVVFVQHESSTGYLEHGTSAWQLAVGLDVKPHDIKVRKTTPDAFLRTDLEEVIRKAGVQKLIICGMHSEFCINTTTRRALALGFPVVLFRMATHLQATAQFHPSKLSPTRTLRWPIFQVLAPAWLWWQAQISRLQPSLQPAPH